MAYYSRSGPSVARGYGFTPASPEALGRNVLSPVPGGTLHDFTDPGQLDDLYLGQAPYDASKSEEPSFDFSPFAFLIACVGFLGTVAILSFFLIGSIGGGDPESEADTDRILGSGDGLGGLEGMDVVRTPPPVITNPPDLPFRDDYAVVPHGQEPAPRRRPAPTVPLFRELICTVGAGATMKYQYPPDGLCHDLYYTHVFISNNDVRPTEVIVSFDVFVATVKNYAKTQGGLAFDIRYNTPSRIWNPAVMNKLSAMQNIMHYGVLIVARASEMEDLMWQANELLEAFKKIQLRDARGKTMIGLGLFGYNETGAWTTYKNWVINAADTFRADTVIAISSTFIFNYFGQCKAAPPDSLTSEDGDYPDFVRHSELVKETFKYRNWEVVVGLSLEMGTIFYTMRDGSFDHATVAYKPCTAAALTGMHVGCSDAPAPEVSSSAVVNYNKITQATFLWDSKETMLQKVEFIKNLPVRRRFAWLYMDLHLADFVGTCKQTDPFEKVLELKRAFSIGERP